MVRVAWPRASSTLAARMASAAGELGPGGLAAGDLSLSGAGGLAYARLEVGDETDKWGPPGKSKSEISLLLQICRSHSFSSRWQPL